jgi:hypothetical protein
MRFFLALVVFSAVARADATLPAARDPPTPACDGPGWLRMRAAVADYCATDAAPSEARGCRVVLRAYNLCEQRLSVEVVGGLRANVRDPKDGSFAWLLSFEQRGAKLTSFRYEFDDCDCC